MEPIRRAGDAGKAFARTRIRPAVRRGVAKIEPLDRAAERAAARRRRTARLQEMYDRLRRVYAPHLREPADGELATLPDIAVVEDAARRSQEIFGAFFRMVCEDGDLERAAVAQTRRLIRAGDTGRARSFGQALQTTEALRPIGDLCVALCAVVEPMPDTVWRLLARNDVAMVLRRAPGEYFRFGFPADAKTASDTLGRVLAGELSMQVDGDTWYDIACQAFAFGAEDLAAQSLDRAETGALSMPSRRADLLRRRVTALRPWLGRRAAARETPSVADGAISVAVVDYKHPDVRRVSSALDDSAESLTAFAHLVRHSGVTYTGDADLVAVAERVRANLPAERDIDGPAGTVRLCSVDRDASSYTAIPDGTWTTVAGWCAQSLVGQPFVGGRYDLPLNPRLRPVFVGFGTDVGTLAADGMLEQLRRHGPVGCRDWDTVFMLLAADVPAFFSGPVASTAGLLAGPGAPVGGDRTGWDATAHDLAENLSAAYDVLRGYRTTDEPVRTGDPRTYLSARAAGGRAEYVVDVSGGTDVEGVVDVTDAELAGLADRLSAKLAAFHGAILAGRSEDEVYAAWREACADDVAAARARLAGVEGFPKLSFDPDALCADIVAAAVTVERSDDSPRGTEINMEFSLDGNYKHQFDVVLDSVVCNTDRPIRAYVLCRDHGPSDFERMARLFPTVSFVWLPTENIDYGPISGMNQWVTPATMDRTLLPTLLKDVDRILHFDLDAMALGDVGELYDVDFAGTAVVGTAESQPRYNGGYQTFIRQTHRIRRTMGPEAAREFVIRTNRDHRFDFLVFNAGIMVMDLDRMRRDDFVHQVLPYVQTFGVNGQVVLNIYTGGDRVEVGPDWNWLIRLELAGDTPKIAHWAGPYKPWKNLYVAGREIWRDGEARFAQRELLRPNLSR